MVVVAIAELERAVAVVAIAELVRAVAVAAVMAVAVAEEEEDAGDKPRIDGGKL